MSYFLLGNGFSSFKRIFISQEKLDEEEKAMLTSNGRRSMEIELSSSCMYKAPINDYFNRSLSENSLSLIEKSWNKDSR